MDKILNHVNKYLIHFSELTTDNVNLYCPVDSILCFDTESCNTTNIKKGKIVQKKNKIEIEKNTIFNEEVHVYSWALSNNLNDFVIYGNHLEDFFLTMDNIAKLRISLLKPITGDSTLKKYKQNMKFKMFVHNLGWDIEFCKYVLNKLGLNYKLSNVDKQSNKKLMTKKLPNTFNIVENDNIVYSANINLGKPVIAKYTKKSKGEKINCMEQLFTSIEMLDSYKIMAMSLDVISKFVISIDEMFLKLSEKYDYEKVRSKNHILSDVEKCYLYNDVYILKEWVNQFYAPLETKCTTASSISFEAFLNNKFSEEKNKYSAFEQYYPDLSEYAVISETIKNSYRGGWTQANKKYVNNIVPLKKAVSIDINSSYPSVVKYKRLPQGTPKQYTGFNPCSPSQNSILTIGFDGFKNKNDDNLIGEIQVGSLSSKDFGMIGTEYVNSNIFYDDNNKLYLKGTNGKSYKYRYEISIWDFELDNILENMEFYTIEKEYDEIVDIYHETENLNVGYDVLSTLTFEMNVGFFGDTVDYYTEKKIEGKKTGNTPMEVFAKLVLNSFYGKLASNYERAERDLKFNEKGLAEFKNTDITYHADKKYYPAFASCVTAWARVNLRTTLYKIGYNNVLYFDTDSLYTTIPFEEVQNKVGDILHPTELGKWDIEKEYDKFKAIGAKKYMLEGKSYGKKETIKLHCKCAGLPSDVREKQTFETFYLGNTFTGKKVKKKVLGGYLITTGTFTLSDNGR